MWVRSESKREGEEIGGSEGVNGDLVRNTKLVKGKYFCRTFRNLNIICFCYLSYSFSDSIYKTLCSYSCSNTTETRNKLALN